MLTVFAKTLRPAIDSLATDSMKVVGKMKPYRPVSLSSMV